MDLEEPLSSSVEVSSGFWINHVQYNGESKKWRARHQQWAYQKPCPYGYIIHTVHSELIQLQDSLKNYYLN